MATEIIDFELERGRHGMLLGREDVMAEVEALLTGAPRGWVLVKGGPGLGKSALLAEWLKRREAAGQRVPHHLLRRGVEDWDKPEVVKLNLAAQVEAQFPEQRDPEPRPGTRLRELLQRVSKQVLEPRAGRKARGVGLLGQDAEGVGHRLRPMPLHASWILFLRYSSRWGGCHLRGGCHWKRLDPRSWDCCCQALCREHKKT